MQETQHFPTEITDVLKQTASFFQIPVIPDWFSRVGPGVFAPPLPVIGFPASRQPASQLDDCGFVSVMNTYRLRFVLIHQ